MNEMGFFFNNNFLISLKCFMIRRGTYCGPGGSRGAPFYIWLWTDKRNPSSLYICPR